MAATIDIGAKPRIVVSDIDHRRLSELAERALGRFPDAEELQVEMDRADVIAAAAVPPDVVQMGSTVAFRSENGQQRRVTIVFPDEADIAAGRISILTPIGTALIGLATGQSIRWLARDGRTHELVVESVAPPVAVSA
jgi:regulator of nucleoside diphosphate kinase